MSNWLQQPMYFSKWIPFVKYFTFADVRDAIPSTHSNLFAHVALSSSLDLPARYLEHSSSKTFTTSFGPGSRQGKRKQAQRNADHHYITKKTKSIRAGRSIKYPDETSFLKNATNIAWETGNPLTRAGCYEILSREFGNTDSEWCNRMNIASGEISA